MSDAPVGDGARVDAAGVDALAERVRALAVAAGRAEAVGRIDELRARLREPLRVAIAGRAKSGKSTLLNALVGERMAPTDASECTRVVTWYRDGPSYTATAELVDGQQAPVPLWREPTGVTFGLDGLEEDRIRRLVVDWPNRTLRSMRVIDTPGLGSLSGIGRRTDRYLAGAADGAGDADVDPEVDGGAPGSATPADAVLYLMRHVHRDDVAFLEAFHDRGGTAASPVNAIGVLSRADEIGGGRLDAVAVALAIARRTAREPAVRRSCRTVVPLAGLVAEVSATLTESEYRAVRNLAGLAETDAEELLLSVDRFVGGADSAGGLPDVEREHLLARFGLFGLRLGRVLLRRQPDLTARGLAAELGRASGLEDLQRLLAESFAARGDALKLRAAFATLDHVLRTSFAAGSADPLRAELESLRARSHVLAELDALLAVRRGDARFDEATAAEAESLLSPGDPAERLGVAAADPAVLRAELMARIDRWRAVAEHPMRTPDGIAVARVLVRTLEGMVTASG